MFGRGLFFFFWEWVGPRWIFLWIFDLFIGYGFGGCLKATANFVGNAQILGPRQFGFLEDISGAHLDFLVILLFGSTIHSLWANSWAHSIFFLEICLVHEVCCLLHLVFVIWLLIRTYSCDSA